MDCVFCEIVGGTRTQTSVVMETEHVIAFDDIRPQSSTHVLVCPKQHVRDAGHLNASHVPIGACLWTRM